MNARVKTTRTKQTKTSTSSDRPAKPVTLEHRVAHLEAQVLALQLVIREMACYADAVGEDTNDLMDEVFGDDDLGPIAA